MAHHVSTRLDTFDDKLDTAKMHGLDTLKCPARCVERIKTSVLSRAVRQADTAKMHGLDTSNVSRRDVMRQAKWNLGLCLLPVILTLITVYVCRCFLFYFGLYCVGIYILYCAVLLFV